MPFSNIKASKAIGKQTKLHARGERFERDPTSITVPGEMTVVPAERGDASSMA